MTWQVKSGSRMRRSLCRHPRTAARQQQPRLQKPPEAQVQEWLVQEEEQAHSLAADGGGGSSSGGGSLAQRYDAALRLLQSVTAHAEVGMASMPRCLACPQAQSFLVQGTTKPSYTCLF